jgi:hypothetical protein
MDNNDATTTVAAAADAAVVANNNNDNTNNNGRCSVRNCKVQNAEKIQCSGADCRRFAHMICYQGSILMKDSNQRPLPAGCVACCKRCNERANKVILGEEEEMNKRKWESDGKNGANDPHTSMKILLDWWLEEGNYSKFCGKNNEGVKKTQFAARLANKMTAETMSTRSAKQVLSKIGHLEKAWRSAHNFATSETGAGILETDGEQTFKEIVLSKCPYYYELLDIMADRASSNPKCTSYDVLSSNDEDDDVTASNNGSNVINNNNDAEVGSNANGLSELSSDELETPEDTGKRRHSTSVASASSNKRNKRISRIDQKRSSGSLFTNTIDLLNEKNDNRGKKFEETKRHNQSLERHHHFLETVEDRKLAVEDRKLALEERKFEFMSKQTSKQRKNEELNYTANLVQKYHEWKKHGMTDKQILRINPDLKVVVDALNAESDDDDS